MNPPPVHLHLVKLGAQVGLDIPPLSKTDVAAFSVGVRVGRIGAVSAGPSTAGSLGVVSLKECYLRLVLR